MTAARPPSGKIMHSLSQDNRQEKTGFHEGLYLCFFLRNERFAPCEFNYEAFYLVFCHLSHDRTLAFGNTFYEFINI